MIFLDSVISYSYRRLDNGYQSSHDQKARIIMVFLTLIVVGSFHLWFLSRHVQRLDLWFFTHFIGWILGLILPFLMETGLLSIELGVILPSLVSGAVVGLLLGALQSFALGSKLTHKREWLLISLLVGVLSRLVSVQIAWQFARHEEGFGAGMTFLWLSNMLFILFVHLFTFPLLDWLLSASPHQSKNQKLYLKIIKSRLTSKIRSLIYTALISLICLLLLNAYIAEPINERNRDSARIERVLEEELVDTNSDGYAEELVIKVQIEVARSGSYELKGYLNNQKGEPITFDIFNPAMQAAGGKGSSTLESGTHQVLFSFSGQHIHSKNDDLFFISNYFSMMLWNIYSMLNSILNNT